MSYLMMSEAPLEDTSKMIISFWFRDASRFNQGETKPDGSTETEKPTQTAVDPPKIKQWPQGFWTSGSKTMVPPNAQYSIGYDAEFKNCVFYWNAYGLPSIGGFGSIIFGDLFLGPAACNIPCAPPVATNTWSTDKGKSAISGVADTDMSPFGVRTLLTFGDDKIPYQYSSWEAWDPGVIGAVDYTALGLAGAAGIVTLITPPPYKPHPTSVGDNGVYHVRSYRLSGAQSRGYVPQSFIGIDKDGYLIINLQTKTTADYQGWAFEQTTIKELWATQTHLVVRGPPSTYTQLGFPFPDGDWVEVGGYWNGYEFEYRDISKEVMGPCPESFAIIARSSGLSDLGFPPTIQDGGWHHLLVSFDLSGAMEIETPSIPDTTNSDLFPTYKQGDPIVHAADCKAWVALDDQNLTGSNLQLSSGVHDGLRLPKLRGTQTTQLLDCGPTGAYNRGEGFDNVIFPRNAWLHGWAGNAKDGLPWTASVSGLVDSTAKNTSCPPTYEQDNCFGTADGDFSELPWTGAIWPLYGGCHAAAPGPWHGTCQPKKPSTPNPAETFSNPKYSCSNFQIPLKGKPIGIPCSTGVSGGPQDMGTTTFDYNTGVEMAELQIWTGQSIDTGDESMRRLFLDYPLDEKGMRDFSKPLQPVKPSVAAARLGPQQVLLHRSTNWKKGRNTGTSGYRQDVPHVGEPDPKGQFSPVAKILKFKPEPKLRT